MLNLRYRHDEKAHARKKKIIKVASAYVSSLGELDPGQYKKRFRRQLQASEGYFVSLDLAKSKKGTLYSAPRGALEKALENFFIKESWNYQDRDLMERLGLRGPISHEVIEHFAVVVGHMICKYWFFGKNKAPK